MPPIEILVIAAIAGWTFDDFCGTPPRPWPGPGRGPWWIRKLIAALGGAISYAVLTGGVINEVTDLVGVVAVGGVGGAFLASLAGGFMGGSAPDAHVNVRG